MKRRARLVNEEEGRGMLKIGEVSKRSGIGIEALRFHEKGGLLDNTARTESDNRVGSVAKTFRLHKILSQWQTLHLNYLRPKYFLQHCLPS